MKPIDNDVYAQIDRFVEFVEHHSTTATDEEKIAFAKAVAGELALLDSQRHSAGDFESDMTVFSELHELAQHGGAADTLLVAWATVSTNLCAKGYFSGLKTGQNYTVESWPNRALGGVRRKGAATRLRIKEAASVFMHLSKEKAAAELVDVVGGKETTIARQLSTLFPGKKWSKQ